MLKSVLSFRVVNLNFKHFNSILTSFYSSCLIFCVSLSLLSTQGFSEAQHEEGFCAFYEECGRNPSVGETLIPPIVPCLNYSPARRLTGEHYRRLKQVCTSQLVFETQSAGKRETHLICLYM